MSHVKQHETYILRNDAIRANLLTKPLINRIEREMLRWFGRIIIMPENPYKNGNWRKDR